MESYLLFSACYIVFDLSAKVFAVDNDFSAVTSFPQLGELYFKVTDSKIKESNLPEVDATLDVETKKNICLSITISGYSAMHGLIPIDDMTTIYDKLQSLVQADPSPVTYYYRELLEDYHQDSTSRVTFSYRSRSRFFNVGSSVRKQEFSFACVAEEHFTHELVIFYISEAYNINTALDVPTEHPVLARFICKTTYGNVICNLEAVAEQPALAMASSDFPVEKTYLENRKFDNPNGVNIADKVSEDPLCQLSKPEKLRICTSVVSSLHFANKIKFIPKEEYVSEQCSLIKVSFRTDDANAKTKDDPWYNEWMLSCSVVPMTPTEIFGNSTILISRAYISHYVYVYSLDPTAKLFYIDNVSGRISPMIERKMGIKNEHKPLFEMNSSQMLVDPIK